MFVVLVRLVSGAVKMPVFWVVVPEVVAAFITRAMCYRGCSPSLITAPKLPPLPRTHSAEPPSDDHSHTKRHQRKNGFTRKRWRNWGGERKKNTFFAPCYLPNNLVTYCTTALNHPVYLNFEIFIHLERSSLLTYKRNRRP
jgi:hypothetical protein